MAEESKAGGACTSVRGFGCVTLLKMLVVTYRAVSVTARESRAEHHVAVVRHVAPGLLMCRPFTKSVLALLLLLVSHGSRWRIDRCDGERLAAAVAMASSLLTLVAAADVMTRGRPRVHPRWRGR